MAEREGIVTMKGNPVTLVGNEVSVGDAAPDFTAVTTSLEPVRFAEKYKGKKVVILSSVPSLDTSVCATQTRKFNEAVGKADSDVVVLTLSMDLPFAQKRWCGAEGIEHVETLSDHREASFGQTYGMLIKELRLLARGVFVVDKEGRICHTEIVKEITEEPNYEAALQAVQKCVG